MEESASAEIQEEANALRINVNEISESQREANSPSGNESQNGEVDRDSESQNEANVSIRNEQQDMVLANDITQMLESSKAPLSRKYCCIYRVPHNLRKLNEEAYSPRFISIGPFHYGDKRLEIMEKLKVRYFKRFVEKATLNVKELVSIIGHREGDVRRCYAEASGLSSDNYVKMILLDASFIIVYFLMCAVEGWIGDDDLLVYMERLLNDMMLLENQLPFFVIEELYNHAFASHSNYPSFAQLTFKTLKYFNTQNVDLDPNLKIIHFIDLLRTFFLPPSQRLPKRNYGEKVMHLYTASQLHEAGVKFMAASSECLFDLKFTNEVLAIPRFVLYDTTESFFRNLMALEQCHYFFDRYVTDYIRILDFLIDTAKDVDLLVRKGILVNRLGDNNAVTTLVNNLCSQIYISETNSDYYSLCKDLNFFYDDPMHSWKATLRRDYFSTPWRIASTVAAIILLLFTFIQTVCTIISLLKDLKFV